MLKILKDIRPKYSKDELTILVMIDFSKAFDNVDHSLLLQKVGYYFGCNPVAVNLIWCYLGSALNLLLLVTPPLYEKSSLLVSRKNPF